MTLDDEDPGPLPMSAVDWDIRREGRAWTAHEARARYELTPEKFEMWQVAAASPIVARVPAPRPHAAALYEPEAVLVGQPGAAARGPAPIREALRGFIGLQPTLTTTASRVLEAGDLALYLGRWRLTGIGAD